jgi:hypothetical protein
MRRVVRTVLAAVAAGEAGQDGKQAKIAASVVADRLGVERSIGRAAFRELAELGVLEPCPRGRPWMTRHARAAAADALAQLPDAEKELLRRELMAGP